MRRILVVTASCLLLLSAGCAASSTEESTQKEENSITSMEAEPELDYKVPESSPNILVDQLGYITDSSKIAIFCGEEMPGKFNIVEKETGITVYVGYPEGKGSQEKGQEKIWYGDFSDFQVPGTYYIEAPVLGRSYSFQIDDNLYDEVFQEACRQYYYNRCGITLTREYAGEMAHNACHTGKAVLREDISVSLDVSGGWHQDELGSKNVEKAARNIGIMLLAYELYGESFTENMGIPESGNGIPDILDEIKYEIEWLLKMQDPVTGAVYEGVTVCEQENGKGTVSYVEPATMQSGKAFAMVLAKFSYLYQNFDTEYATNCLKAADRAWKYTELNDDSTTDEWKFAAAAELYRASGLKSCHRYITEYLLQEEEKKELDEVTFLGYVTYISTKQQVDMELCSGIAENLMTRAEEISNEARNSVYLVGENVQSDQNQSLLQDMMILTTVDYIIANHEYENIIENHLHYFMGRNSQSLSYIDRVGENNYKLVDENLGIMKGFDTDSKLIFMLSEIVSNHRR